MWKVTRKGLAANKIRFVLTAIAVILGVAFVSGTLVLTATIQKTFDDLFTNIYANTDAVVRAPGAAEQRLRLAVNVRTSRVACSPKCRAPRAWPQAEGDVQIAYAQVVGSDGKAVGNPGQGAPTLGFAYHPDSQLSVFHLVEGAGPDTQDQVAIDKNTADNAKVKIGDDITILTTLAPRTYHLVGIVRFGNADSLAGASASLFTMSEAQRLANAPNEFSQISVKADSGVSQTQLQQNLTKSLKDQGQKGVRGHHRGEDHQGEPGRDPEAAQLLQHRAADLRPHRADRRRRHHLQHVLDRRRATHARDGAAARDRRQPAPGDGPGVRRVRGRRRAGVGGRRRRRRRSSRSASKR